MHVSHASSLAVSLLTKDYGSLGSAPSGTSGQSGALLAPPITLCDDCQHDKLATAFGHYVKKRSFLKATSRSALAFSVATSPASKTATRFRRSRRWRKWPAHLRSLSINSSTRARNRLSCPISRNARLGTKLPGAAPAKTPVFWPSSADCRSEEHTSELQSPCNLVCRLLLEKKKKCHKYARVHLQLP